MASQTTNRARFLLGCGGAALAVSLALTAQEVSAQAFQASPEVVVGDATIDRSVVGQDTITANTNTVVIDWFPDEVSGSALDFLPTGATAIFQNNPDGVTDFAILNRILPSQNGDIVVIDGTVISRLDLGNGFNPGGFVAFYSPTGILVGANAVFDVGGLMLTALDPDVASFAGFSGGGVLNLAGGAGSTAQVRIEPGASIGASSENSFFIAAAPRVVMNGTANINGSTAYIAAERVDLTFSNGLFDIVVPIGTSVGTGIEHNGTTTGPASSGVGDNHVIYGVIKGETNPVQMLLRGNLGFEPAVVAGVDNGDIILAANFDVFGKSVNGGNPDDGTSATFAANAQTSAVEANIFVDQFTGSSDLLAISTHRTQVLANAGPSAQAGDLLVVGGVQALIQAGGGNDFAIDGDVLVTATDYGLETEGNFSPPLLDAFGGEAFINAAGGGRIVISGNAFVASDAIAGMDSVFLVGGNAQAGTALIGGTGGSITIDGSATVSASASGPADSSLASAGNSTGGLAQYFATQGGQVAVGQDLLLAANASGTQFLSGPNQAGSAATGGQAFLNVFDGGGSAIVAGDVVVDTSAVAGPANTSGVAAAGLGGHSAIVAEVANSSITIGGTVDMRANGLGAANAGGVGGDGVGGRSRVSTFGGDVAIAGSVDTRAEGRGGIGLDGGLGVGGIAGVFALVGSVDIAGSVTVFATGTGGNAGAGFGGRGGDAVGGNAFVQAEGTLTENARIVIGNGLLASADATGGTGGGSDGSDLAAGNGGEARGGQLGTPVQSDPAFGGGAYALAQGDRGTLRITGNTELSASGFGGQGGSGAGSFDGGDGGDGFGGTAQAGMFIGTGNGSVGQGVAEFGAVNLFASGRGGAGGTEAAGDNPSATGGDGTGGGAFFTARASTATADAVLLDASGFGGPGYVGGAGSGGNAGLLAGSAGTAQVGALVVSADGRGAESLLGAGATGTGGAAFVEFQGGTALIAGGVALSASGFGGDGGLGDGGDGIGGTAEIANATAIAGTGTIGGIANLSANGIGGNALSAGFTGGEGTGGEAYLLTQAGGTLQINTAKVIASGQGGTGPAATGGNGTGGLAYIESRDAGSRVTVLNAPASAVNFLDQGSLVAANGIGGDTRGGTAIGGTGTGGTMTVLAANGGTVALPQGGGFGGLVRLLARGQGGNSSVEGGTGGLGVGGIGTVAADGGTLTGGPLQISVFAQGGSSANSAANIDGGDGTGGERYIRVTSGGTLTASFPGGVAGGVGGNGSGSGSGGDGSGGIANLEVIGGTANLIGRTIVVTQNTGGNGVTGGNAALGIANLLVASGGTVNVLPDATGLALVSVGNSSLGGIGSTGNGGAATAQAAFADISSGTVNGGTLEIQSLAAGGSSTSGNGGAALAGSASVTITDSNVDLAAMTVTADARGGISATATHGAAAGGSAALLLGGTDFTTTVATRVTAIGTSGTVGAGGASGLAEGGVATLEVSGGSTMAAGAIEVLSGAQAPNGGTAEGGVTSLRIDGAQASTAQLTLDATGIATGSTAARGGVIDLTGLAGGLLQADAATARVGASGASGINQAGDITLEAVGATFDFTTLVVDAVSPSAGSRMVLRADAGQILVRTSADIASSSDIEIEAVNGGLIGGPTVSAPTASIALSTPGAIIVTGNNDNAISFGGASLSLSSSELEIGAGARIGAQTVAIVSSNTANAAVLGGTVEEPGYTLTAAEIARIEAGEVTFTAPLIAGLPANAPDVLMRDMTLTGSLDDGPSRIILTTPGTIRVEGVVAYIDTTPDDRLEIFAGERIEIVTPGGIGVVDGEGDPGGVLSLAASDIWAADADTIAQLQAGLNFAGRDDILATAAGGSDDPLGYVRGGTVELVAGRSLLVRNTGTEREPGGILVGEGGLGIAGGLNVGDPDQLDVFAYGRQQTASGGFVFGQAFYDQINFNRTGDAATDYLDSAEFNDCVINTNECERFVDDIIEMAPPVNNPIIFEVPISAVDPIPPAEDEGDAQFGVDFPGLVEAPLLSQETLLEDPVTSGGDSALYALEDDSEDDEDESDEE